MAKQQLVLVLFMIVMAAASVTAQSEEPPLDANIIACIRDKVTLGLCVQREILSFISTRELDLSSCCSIVDGITKDCYPFVTEDPVFRIIYNKFCSAPTPSATP